jgi:hypothetical protein
MKKLIFLLFLINFANAQTLRINEFSNGTSGAKEWIEILVAPTSPTIPSLKTCFYNSINVSGWIIDDNNGDFSPLNQNNGSGIATGHLRFKNVAPWTRLPAGALIVIYNNLDPETTFPVDDPYDFNNDCVYILPANHVSLEYCANAPQTLTCSTRLDYGGCLAYADYNGTTRSWSAISLANAGDAMQIRDASFNLIHGVVYGRSTTTSCGGITNMTGTPLAPLISTANGSNTFYAYNGLDLNGYFDATKWITGSASLATPGAYNNTNNQIWIKDTIRKGCICDVTLHLDTYKNYLIREFEKSLIIQQTKNQLIFKSDNMHNIKLSLFQPDGRLLNITNFWFKGLYYFNRPEGFFIVNISVSTGFGTFYTKTFRIF